MKKLLKLFWNALKNSLKNYSCTRCTGGSRSCKPSELVSALEGVSGKVKQRSTRKKAKND